MSFVSYAQNFEDVMLWRALRHVKTGFYIDVGANDPNADSVTKAFYERGWHGINIEPLPSHHDDLSKERPRDINLQCAAGPSNGEIEVWECDVRGWATASANVVAQHSADGHKGFFHRVPVLSLTEICTQHVTSDIHFLKIDVEGFEKSVIDGIDFSRFRPWILVIEATRPNSTEEIHSEWEELVLSVGYVLAYCDGLNRFYVAEEHPELLGLLRYPPNVFDGFIRSEQLNSELSARQAENVAVGAEAKAQQAEAKAQQAQTEALQAEAKAQHAEAAVNQYLAQLRAVYASTSWRITTPLRSTGRAVIWLRSKVATPRSARASTHSDFHRVAASILNRVVSYAKKAPLFRRVVLRLLNRIPGLHIKLRQIHIQSQLAPYPHHGNWSSNQTPMSAGHTSLGSGGDASRPPSIYLSNGINARQRTPLEAYFHDQGGSE